jgi:hypothetical protein
LQQAACGIANQAESRQVAERWCLLEEDDRAPDWSLYGTHKDFQWGFLPVLNLSNYCKQGYMSLDIYRVEYWNKPPKNYISGLRDIPAHEPTLYFWNLDEICLHSFLHWCNQFLHTKFWNRRNQGGQLLFVNSICSKIYQS